MAVTLTSRPTLVETEDKKLRFLIMDAPTESNLPQYLKEFKLYHVTHMVRVCQETYRKDLIVSSGIKFFDMAFDDGSSPPANIINQWLDLVDDVFPPPEHLDGAASGGASSGGSGPGGKKLHKTQSHQDTTRLGDDATASSVGSNMDGLADSAPSSPNSGAPRTGNSAVPSSAKPCVAIHCVAGLGRAPVLVAIALMERTGMSAEDAVAFIRKKRRGAINATQLAFVQRYVPRRKKKCIIM